MEKLGKEGDAVKEGMGRDCREEGRTGVGEVPGFCFMKQRGCLPIGIFPYLARNLFRFQ